MSTRWAATAAITSAGDCELRAGPHCKDPTASPRSVESLTAKYGESRHAGRLLIRRPSRLSAGAPSRTERSEARSRSKAAKPVGRPLRSYLSGRPHRVKCWFRTPPLKRRAASATRPVPVPPQFVGMLRAHVLSALLAWPSGLAISGTPGTRSGSTPEWTRPSASAAPARASRFSFATTSRSLTAFENRRSVSSSSP